MATKSIAKVNVDAEIVKAIAGDESADLDMISANEMTASILEKILSATTVEGVDDAAGPFEAVNSRSLAGSVITITGVAFLPTAFGDDETREAGSPNVYATMTIVDEDGEVGYVRTSSASTMAQLLQYRRLGAFPLTRRVMESDKQTRRGFRPIWLEPA